jgi:hypothetical protein
VKVPAKALCHAGLEGVEVAVPGPDVEKAVDYQGGVGGAEPLFHVADEVATVRGRHGAHAAAGDAEEGDVVRGKVANRREPLDVPFIREMGVPLPAADRCAGAIYESAKFFR